MYMDIERMKKISEAKIKAGNVVNKVRNTLKEIEHGRQDVQEELSEVYKPVVKAQEDVKQTIDEKQNLMLEQLQKNQKAITSGLEDILMLQQLPDVQPQTTQLPIDYKPAMMEPQFKSDIDSGFDKDEIQKLTNHGLYPPGDVLKASMNGTIDVDEDDKDIGKKLNKLGAKKGNLSKHKTKHKDQIDEITKDIKLIQKYRDRIQIIEEGKKTLVGTGYTQPKRNAYKISSGGQYGNLIIDVPKLMGQLHLVAKKDGNKVLVLDKKVDFDTIDLLTKRFNSKKQYSGLSKMVFNELNKLSEIPIHRSSRKYSKLGAGVIYYNNINDLIDRMELLGGGILAGNNALTDEFSEIVHKLHQLGKIDKGTLNKLLKVYVI